MAAETEQRRDERNRNRPRLGTPHITRPPFCFTRPSCFVPSVPFSVRLMRRLSQVSKLSERVCCSSIVKRVSYSFTNSLFTAMHSQRRLQFLFVSSPPSDPSLFCSRRAAVTAKRFSLTSNALLRSDWPPGISENNSQKLASKVTHWTCGDGVSTFGSSWALGLLGEGGLACGEQFDLAQRNMTRLPRMKKTDKK